MYPAPPQSEYHQAGPANASNNTNAGSLEVEAEQAMVLCSPTEIPRETRVESVNELEPISKLLLIENSDCHDISQTPSTDLSTKMGNTCLNPKVEEDSDDGGSRLANSYNQYDPLAERKPTVGSRAYEVSPQERKRGGRFWGTPAPADKHKLDEELKCANRDIASKAQIIERANRDIGSKAQEIEHLKKYNRKLQEEYSNLKQKFETIQQQLLERAGRHGSYVDGLQTPTLLELTAKDMFSSIATFSNLLSRYRDSEGNCPARECVRQSSNEGNFARDNHWKKFLKHLLCMSLFRNFECETFKPYENAENTLLFFSYEEREETCYQYFDSCKSMGGPWDRALTNKSPDRFDRLFLSEYLASSLPLLLWSPQEQHILRNRLFHKPHDLLSELGSEQRKLLQSLVLAAGKVWQFHKLCLSFETPAAIFRVSSGAPFDHDLMESTDSLGNDDDKFIPKVGFMTYPGFLLRKCIIKSEVYVAVEN